LHEQTLESQVANEKKHDPDKLNLDLDLVAQLGNGHPQDVQPGSETMTADAEEPTEEEKDILRRSKMNIQMSRYLD